MNAKARNKAIYELIKIFKNNTDTVSELSITELSNGFISQDNQILFDELYNKYYNESDIDTDYDKSLFSSFFYTQNNKILGTEKTGSGFINPIKTIGKIEDLNTLIPFEIKPIKHIEHKIEKSENSTDFKKETIVNSFVTQSSTDILSIEDSLKIYSPTITNAEIKGFVYYKQKFGSPMYGWEKWFLVDDKVGKLAYSTDSFHLKDENMLDIKKVPSNTLLGVKTEITKDIDGDLYYGIKSENKEIYYVLEECFIEQDSYSITDTDKLDDLVKEKGLCFDGNDYVPVYMYTFGDIYELKEKLVGKYDSVNDIFTKGYKDLLIQKFGIDIANWHEELIETAIVNKNNFDFANPIALERPYLSKENELSHSFMINELDIDCGVSIKKHHDELDSNKVWKNKVRYSEASRISLFKAYEIWFAYNVTDNMLEKTTSYDVKNLYFKNGVVYLSEAMQEKSKKEQDTEKDERRILAKLEGDRFYSEFLATALIQNDLIALNRTFNKMYNNFVNYDLDKVPVGFEANKKIFNLDNFKLKSVQRNGLAFLNINNSGCLAYEVGFGKTLAAIHNLAILLKQGSIKRPLIAVPKTVYKNWICEMFGFWTNGSIKSLEQFNDSYFVNGALTGTQYKLNDWYNLRGNKKPDNSEIDEYTITLVTYQGLELIGFSEDLYSEMNEDLFEILNVKTDDQTDRDIEKLREQNETLVGKALTKTEFDIDILGFDYLVLDEAHSFKNIFTSFAIPTEFRDSWRMTKGTQSLRALKAFSLSLYIQKKYNGNVNILTATPFTNSPLELYSMLSLVGYNYLVNSNINNLFKFMSLFIETQVEYTVDHLQNIVLNTVIKSFKNKNILRDVLYRFFDYQDNPIDSGIKRPNKINFPNSAVSTYLEMSELQMTAQGLVVDEANNYSADNKGAMGRALSWAKSNAFSPYLLPDIEKYSNIDTFIENSPKLKYTIECIKSVKKHHESVGQECSGQVIYSNRGKVLFQDFKKAIEKECRFIKRIKFGDSYVDEVEVIIASTSDSDAERKELIKDAFNSGIVKVIIGTATIQEGINLQKTGTCLYNLDLDWNPTSFKQLEGRIHRQGNKFKNVRIVVPMVQGTLDSFINQKLDEKSKRIASIWDKNHNVNNYVVTDALDPMEIKFNLINDAEQLLKMKLDIVTEQAKKEFMLCKDKMDTFEILEGVLKTFFNTKNRVLPLIEKTVENYKRYLILLEKYEIADNKYYSSNKSNIEYVINNINEILKMYDDFVSNNNWRALFYFRRACTVRKFYAKVKDVKGNESEVNYKNLYSPYKYVSLNEFGEHDFENIVTQYRKCKRLEKIILKPYGVSFFDNIASIKSEYLNNFNKAKAELESLKTDDFKKVIHDEICLELEKRQEGIGSLHDRVTAFAETNNLLC